NIDESVSILKDWQIENPNDLRLDLMLAGLHLRQNETEQAVNYYNKILLNDSENLIALNNLSWLYIDTDLSRAFELADKANTLNPNDPGIMDTLGWILVNQGKIEQGQNLLFKALNLFPDSADIRYHYAYSLAEAGEEQKAISELSTILNDDNNFMERPAAEELMNRLR
ncbi:MAG: tetratricopeptide repeat protein, partial [Gammaproteobacteria bacterium]|nr:tetratricopeptide repeat protein [Gammaproteobacteria bacterium]